MFRWYFSYSMIDSGLFYFAIVYFAIVSLGAIGEVIVYGCGRSDYFLVLCLQE